MIEKKKHLEESAITGIIKKIAEGSIEFRLKKKEQEQTRQKMTENQKILNSTLQ
jgi:hypothetical protein